MADDELGSGAYACVRTAISLENGEEYAVKLVDKHEPGHTHSRIRREVEIFRMCKDHPNIVQLVDVSSYTGCYGWIIERVVDFSASRTRTATTWSSRRCTEARCSTASSGRDVLPSRRLHSSPET